MAAQAAGDRGFTILELLVVILILGVLVAMAAVRLDRARMSGNESSAVGSLRAINAAQATYASSCGAAGYAQSLDDLAKAPSGSMQAFISADLATNGILKSGYIVALQADSDATVVTPVSRACNAPASHAMSAYFASATPSSTRSGRRTFATDKRNTIYVNDEGAAISPGMYGAVPLQ